MAGTLNFEQFANVLSSLVSDGRRSQERRAHPRVGGRMRIQFFEVSPEGAKPIEEAWLRDISLTGLGISLLRPIRPAARIVLILDRPHQMPVIVVYAVTHVRRGVGASLAVGARALEGAEATEARDWLASCGALIGREMQEPSAIVYQGASA